METRDQTRLGESVDHYQVFPHEGTLTRRIERQTAKTPSLLFLSASAISIIGSIALYASGKRMAGVFVGHWAPMFMLLGMYNKLVKEEYELVRLGQRQPTANR